MSRIMAIDYGSRRVGLAVTDSLQIIASPLQTVSPSQLIAFLKHYFEQEEVEQIVIGYPSREDGSPTDATPMVEALVRQLTRTFPHLKFTLHDERYTSKMAQKSMVQSGARKKARQKKSNLDQISATLILQSFLEEKKFYS